jgi:hypothetical protein
MSKNAPTPNEDELNSSKISEILKKAEDALSAIHQFRDDAKTDAGMIAELQTQTGPFLAEIQTKLIEITTASTQSVAAKTQIVDLQAVIAAKSDHIESAQIHADKVRADLDRKLTEATQTATEAEGLKSRAQSAADTAAEVLAEIRTTKGSVETEAEAVAQDRENVAESAAVTKALADKAATIETRIAEYEKQLVELGGESASRLKTIEGLLPGATSVGLAHSLDERRKSFVNPHSRWQWIFVGSLLAIVFIAITGMWHVYHLEKIPTYDELARLWLARLPVAGALLWLALHASREAALAKRLEEDYGYKSAIASSFEGFRRQMADIDADVRPDSPLAKLCVDTLATIATPPGRIYDKHELVVSPMKEFRDSAQAAADAVKPVVDAAKVLRPLS